MNVGVMGKLYKLMVVISALIRQFVLPNPFDKLPHPFAVEFSGASITIPPLMLNLIIEPILHTFTFLIVGIYYTKGEFPAFGSFLYLVFYSLHVGLLTLMAMMQFSTWAIILVLILYSICHIMLLLLINRRSAI